MLMLDNINQIMNMNVGYLSRSCTIAEKNHYKISIIGKPRAINIQFEFADLKKSCTKT